MLYVQIDPFNPDVWRLDPVLRSIQRGGLGVIPTDTVYAFVCDIGSKTAIERLYALKDLDPRKPLSILCRDFQMVATYTRGFPTSLYRTVRRCLPGPYTFILPASSLIPRLMLRKRRTVGVRIPKDTVCEALLEDLERPLLCTSVRMPDDSPWNNPAEIEDAYKSQLDFVVDAGERLADPSTVVDLSEDEPVVLRKGKGDVSMFEP